MTIKTKRLTMMTMMMTMMIVAGFFVIPLPGLPVPIVLQNMMMMLAGGFLGKKYGPLTVATFLFFVAVGFPFLSGGTGGIAVFTSVSSGFLLGYVVSPLVIGYLIEKNQNQINVWSLFLIYFIGGALLINFFGSFSMAYFAGKNWLIGLKMTLVFIPMDTVKALLSAWLTFRLRKYSLIEVKK